MLVYFWLFWVSTAALEFLGVVASPVVARRLQGTWASVAVACGLRNWDARALEPGLSSRGSQA